MAIDDAELDAMEQRCGAATPGPWWAWFEGRDGFGGDSFIGQGSDEPGTVPARRDLYLSTYKDEPPVPVADYDFIAHARQDVPRLIAEVRRLRRESDSAPG